MFRRVAGLVSQVEGDSHSIKMLESDWEEFEPCCWVRAVVVDPTTTSDHLDKVLRLRLPQTWDNQGGYYEDFYADLNSVNHFSCFHK